MKYHVASNTKDYNKVQALIQKEGITKTRLSFPTVMAFDGDELVGALGTRIDNKMIVAGPLVLRSDKRRVFTGIRLAEAYEMAMRNLGIKSFIIYGETGGLLTKAIERYYPGITPYSMKDGNSFYVWSIDHGRRQPQDTRAIS